MGKSHFLYASLFVKALLDREHEVTFVTIYSLENLKLKNYTEIRIDPPLNVATRSKLPLLCALNQVTCVNLIQFCFWLWWKSLRYTGWVGSVDWRNNIFINKCNVSCSKTIEQTLSSERKCSTAHQQHWITFWCYHFGRFLRG